MFYKNKNSVNTSDTLKADCTFSTAATFPFIFTRKSLRYVRVFAVAISSVCLSSVTLVHPTQGVEAFGNISSPLCTLAIL